MKKIKSFYNIIIVGAGHNGLVAACYLAQAGLSVLVLEKNDHIGGATLSEKVFEGVDARLSKYSYLVSMLPQQIITDLGINFEVKKRRIGSFTPDVRNGKHVGLLVSNASKSITHKSFNEVTGSDIDYEGFNKLYEQTIHFAQKVWPGLLKPMNYKKDMKKLFHSKEEQHLWNSLIEEPLNGFVERYVKDDLVRGVVFTDGKIGNPTYTTDTTLLQNKTFLYHILGGGTGVWNVPVGGMGNLVQALVDKATSLGVMFLCNANVTSIDPHEGQSETYFTIKEKKYTISSKYVLVNAAPKILKKILKKIPYPLRPDVEGTAFKVNMVLKKLPWLQSGHSPKDAFAGTFHIDEGYTHMDETYKLSQQKILPKKLAGEMYCHTLTDDSILSLELRKKGYQTLTLFGIDIPYKLFEKDNEKMKKIVTEKFLDGINQYLAEPIEDCFALDKNGNPCIESKSALDLENDVGLPYGNIFQTSLSWPFLEDDEQYRRWGVEIGYNNIFFCGSGAMRGGCVSGIPGHNAAMKVLESLGKIKL